MSYIVCMRALHFVGCVKIDAEDAPPGFSFDVGGHIIRGLLVALVRGAIPCTG